MTSSHDPRLVGLAAVVCAAIAVAVPVEAVRVIVTLPLVLLLPGYAVVAAAFGARLLDVPQRFLLALACSLMIAILGGIVLNSMPGGIDTLNWALLLVAVTVVACWIAARRRRGRPHVATGGEKLRVGRGELAMFAAAALIAVAAIVLAQTPFPANDARGFTALAMLPETEGAAVEVDVISSEQHSQRYVLEVGSRRSGRPEVRRFALEPGETTSVRIPVSVDGRQRIDAVLYRANDPNRVYRRVTTWLGGSESGP